jgi:hypothetical protein
MPRVDPEDVLAIRPSATDPIPFILTASLMVDTYLLDENLSELFLAEIEKWWAAHLAEVSQPLATSKKLSNTTVTVSHGKLGEGLASTRYGQQVLAFWPALGQVLTVKQAKFHVF